VNTKRVNAAADVIARARKNGKQTPAGWAVALESAQMLMSPEIAAELESLRNRVAELEAERHVTNEALSDAAERLRADRDRIAELERRVAAEECRCPEPAPLCGGCRCRCHKPGESPDALTRMFAPTQALREPMDGEHYASVHHDYRIPHDMPQPGSAT
jgi:hypothetical protein